MTHPLTPESIAHLYEYNRSLPPFSNLTPRMPAAEDVEFWVVKDRARRAWYRWMGERHRISVSSLSISFSVTLIADLGHEMIHLWLEEAGLEGDGNENVHNRHFRKMAARFCKVHGIDQKAFF